MPTRSQRPNSSGMLGGMCITQLTTDFAIEICDEVMEQTGLRTGDVVTVEVTGPGRIEILGLRAANDGQGGPASMARDDRD